MNAQEWEREVQLYRESGMTVNQWCNSRGYKSCTFKNRLYKRKPKQEVTQFIEVKPAKVSKLKIELAGGASILIDEYTDMTIVNKLLRSMK